MTKLTIYIFIIDVVITLSILLYFGINLNSILLCILFDVLITLSYNKYRKDNNLNK